MPFISAHSLKCYNKPSLNNYLVYAQMATENVGGIQYTVDADTAAMLKAEAVVNKSIANQVKQFDKADQAVRDFIVTQEKLGRTVNSMGQVMDSNGKIVANATNQYRSMATAANSSFGALNTQINSTTKGIRNMRPDMTNMSYQLQDIAVQAQMGTNAFVIMGQQLPQMLVGMGAWAAGIGAAIAVLGVMATTLIDTTTDLQKLEKALENTKAIMTLSAKGVASYTEEMKNLSRVSEALTKIKIALAITENTRAIKESKGEFASMRAELFGFQEDSTEAAKRLTGMTDKTGDVLNLASSLNRFGAAITDEQKLKALEEAEQTLLSMRSEKGEFPTKDLAEFAEKFLSVASATRQVISANKALKESNSEVNEQIENDGEAFEKLRINMKEQIIALEDGERAAYKYSLLMSKEFTPAQIEAALKLYDKKKAIEADIEATNEAIEADKKRKKSLDDVSASLDAYFDKESADSTNQDRKDTATLTTQVQSIGLTPEEEIQARYDRELELLQQAEEKKIEIEGTYAERRTQIEAERLEALRNLNSDNIDFLSEAFSNLDTQIAGTMAQVVVGAKDGETAMRDLASTMITQVVGALVQQGVELVKNKVLGNVLATSEKANILSTTATGVAAQQTATASTTAAAATTATAAAPAAALTSTFSFGSAALIGGAALLGTLAISKMMASGAREFGGPVTAGKSYLVGERGPEMFTPNTSGGIVSNKDMTGGGSGVSVNINNYSGQEVTQNYDEVRKIVTVEIGKQISGIRSGTGAMAKALKGTTTNKGRATKV
ncbi:putative tail length tape-measure protein [Pseudoalteromonas phage C7]|uniref:tail length tape measure protein n=1 Tax=Pseudoalteromonas phage C7 TaxID=2510494 RepID=UPI00101787E2|nr:tail length tape measure protein [Pseudoalteromonas phage C7]QAY17959.1 putative tail length tape-measure protein [Pseudoalteromonas phage C7]